MVKRKKKWSGGREEMIRWEIGRTEVGERKRPWEGLEDRLPPGLVDGYERRRLSWSGSGKNNK